MIFAYNIILFYEYVEKLPADQQEQNRLFFLKETGAERYITHAW
jgi:hypothetical protein